MTFAAELREKRRALMADRWSSSLADFDEILDIIEAADKSAGVVSVPMNPTKRMWSAALVEINDDAERTVRHAYRAMLAAVGEPND